MAGMTADEVKALLNARMTEVTAQFTKQLNTLKTEHQTELTTLREQLEEKDEALVELQRRQNPPPAVTAPPLPPFTGSEDCEQQFSLWEVDFRADMEAQFHRQDVWVRHLRRYLAGKALLAYHEFLSIDSAIPYDSLAEKFRRRFDKTKTVAEYQAVLDRLQWGRDEKIDGFVERLFATCSKAKREVNQTDREREIRRTCHDIFLKCMPFHTRQHLRNRIWNEQDPDAPVELSQLAKWVKQFQSARDADAALDTRPPKGAGGWQGKPSAAAVSSPLAGSPAAASSAPSPTGGTSQPPPFAAAGGAPRVETRKCFQCNQTGHVRPQCPQLQRNRPHNSQFASSNVAGASGVGHVKVVQRTAGSVQPAVPSLSSSRPPLLADVDQRVDAAPLKERIVESPRSFSAKTMMFLPVTVSGCTVEAQVDTGSPVVIVNGEIIELLSAKLGRDVVNKAIQKVPQCFYDMQHNVLPLSGMIDIDFELNGTVVSCPAMINLKMDRPLLLGLSFFERIGLEMTIPTGESAVRWILSPDRQVNGDPISVFFGRYRRKTVEQKGNRRRQQLQKRKEQRRIVNVVASVQTRFPDLSSGGAVLAHTAVLEARQAHFVEMFAMNREHFGCDVLLSEFGLDVGDNCSVPDQLVTVGTTGYLFAEVRNDSSSDVLLNPGELIVRLQNEFVDGATAVKLDLPHVDRCARCRRSDVAETVASLSVNPPAMPWNLYNLRYDSLDERQLKICERANIAGDNSAITAEQRSAMLALLRRNHDVLALDDSELGECTLDNTAHTIDTGEHAPIALPCRRVPFGIRQGVDQALASMKENGVIRNSSSPWSSPIVPVKKSDGSIRITVDYRRLNDITRKDRYPLARCEDLLDEIGIEKPEYFTTLDLVQGYHQQRMDPSSIAKTAFSCPSGHFEYTRLPMGLCNSPANFQRLQDSLLKGVDRNKVKVYLDDVAIVTREFSEHIQQLQMVFDRFRAAGLRVKLSKCQFLRKEVVYLGFLVDKTGLRPNPKRVQGIQEIQPPTTVREVRRFIGCCSYYRRFVKNFATIARPLTNLMQNDVRWQWKEAQQKAFEVLKEMLVSPPVLHYPRFDRPFFIVCDASAQGLGAILHQKDDAGRYAPIAFASRATHKTEQNYSATDLEALCLTWSLQHFHHYIWSYEVVVEVDHQPLTCLNSKLKLPPRLERWNAIIHSYDAKIVYRRGSDNEPADMLSRYRVAGSASQPAVDESVMVGLISDAPPVEAIEFPSEIVNQRELQMHDAFFGRLLRYLEAPTDYKENDRVELQRLSKHYRVIEGVLYFVGRNSIDFPRICVPVTEQSSLIESYHQGKNSGAHLAADKTYRALALKFFWPSMKNEVFQFCRRCLVCARERGVERRRRPPLQPIRVESEPFMKIGIDIMKLPKTKKGNHCVLGVVDYFSGYIKFIALSDEKAETVARALVENVFNVFGAPKFIISDQGVNFTSVLLRELESIYCIRHHFTSTFMPRSNGKIERANRTLKAVLTRMTLQYPDDWDELLSHILFAYNSTPQDSTGYAPHYLVFGRLPQPVNDSIFDRKTLGHKLDLDDYVSEFERRLSFAYKIVEEELGKSQIRQKQQYDKSARSSDIVVGDSVMLYRPDMKQSKLTALYDGPFTVEWLKGSVAGIRGLNAATVETHNLEKLSRCEPDMTAIDVPKRKLRTHFRRRQETTALQGGGGRRYNLRSSNAKLVVSAGYPFTPMMTNNEEKILKLMSDDDRATTPPAGQSSAVSEDDYVLYGWSDDSEGQAWAASEGQAAVPPGDPRSVVIESSSDKSVEIVSEEEESEALETAVQCKPVGPTLMKKSISESMRMKRRLKKKRSQQRKRVAKGRQLMAAQPSAVPSRPPKSVLPSVRVWDTPPPGLCVPSTSAVLGVVAPMQGGRAVMHGATPRWDVQTMASLGTSMGRDLDLRQQQNLYRRY